MNRDLPFLDIQLKHPSEFVLLDLDFFSPFDLLRANFDGVFFVALVLLASDVLFGVPGAGEISGVVLLGMVSNIFLSQSGILVKVQSGVFWGVVFGVFQAVASGNLPWGKPGVLFGVTVGVALGVPSGVLRTGWSRALLGAAPTGLPSLDRCLWWPLWAELPGSTLAESLTWHRRLVLGLGAGVGVLMGRGPIPPLPARGVPPLVVGVLPAEPLNSGIASTYCMRLLT